MRPRFRFFVSALAVFSCLALAKAIAPLEPPKGWGTSLKRALSSSTDGQWYYDRHGELLRVISDQSASSDHIEAPPQLSVTLNQMNFALYESTLCLEDRSFYEHSGIPLRGVLRALWKNLLAGRRVAGGSGISQQVIKRFRGRARGLLDKVGEARYALWLEDHFSKDQILAAYLNHISFGHQQRGIWRASWRYFGRAPHLLSIAQSAYLASLPFSPTRLSPLRSPQAAIPRQRSALHCLLSRGLISEDQFRLAIEEPIIIQGASPPFEATHLVESVHYHRVLVHHEDGDSKTRKTATHLSLDLQIQKRAQKMITRYLSSAQGQGIDQIAAVGLSTKTGEVYFWVGSGDYERSRAGQVDHVLGLRLPGSTLKPFLYGLALDQGFELDSLLPDQPIYFKTARGQYRPQNYDQETRGDIPLMSALAMSLNIPSVWLLNQCGVDEFLNILRLAGLNSLKHDASHYGLGLSLGDGEVRLIDLANAYRGLAHDGMASPWHTLLVSSNLGGKKVHSHGYGRFMSPRAAQAILHVLSNRSLRAPSFGEDGPLTLPFPAAVKTGTSQGYTNSWTVGLSSEYTVGVWVRPKKQSGLSGGRVAAPIWHDLMMSLHQGISTQPFNKQHLTLKDLDRLTALESLEESEREYVSALTMKPRSMQNDLSQRAQIHHQDDLSMQKVRVKLIVPPHEAIYSRLPDRGQHDNQLRAEAVILGLGTPREEYRYKLSWEWSGGELPATQVNARSLWFDPWTSKEERQRLCVVLMERGDDTQEAQRVHRDCATFRVLQKP